MALLYELLPRQDEVARLAGLLLDARQPEIIRTPDFTIAPYLSEETVAVAIERGISTIGSFVDDNTIILCNLNGAIWFTARVLDALSAQRRNISFQQQLRFIKVTSTTGILSRGIPIIMRWFDNPAEVTGKNVVIFEDIIDTGETLVAITNVLAQYKPAKVSAVVLFEKDGIQKTYAVDYSIMHIENKFVFGSGLDDGKDRGRDAPGLWEIVPKG